MSFAIYYHIKNRTSERRLEIFDEKLHPLTVNHYFQVIVLVIEFLYISSSMNSLQKDEVSDDYDCYNPEHREIYKFVRTLFNAAQLTAECAIITLVYLER